MNFAGFQREVYDYIAHADAILMPSLHEGLPYTILEAMSLGTPILATRVGGLAEVLVPNENALLFEPRSEDGVASAVVQLATDSALGQKLARNAREACHARFSSAVMADSYQKLFRQVAGRR